MYTIIKVKTKDEIKITANLAKEIYTEHYSSIIGISQVKYMLDKFQNESAISQQIDNNTLYYIIYSNSEPCGYFAVDINVPKGKLFLSKLYIRKTARGQGLAKQALELMKQISSENSLSSIWLHVNKNNPSIEIYKSMGFKITESVKNDIGGGFFMDDYLMEMNL